MYKVKKAQYLLYKHCLLHGLNISIVLSESSANIGTSSMWRLHWISLNAAYTLEFFLQSLVRRRILAQCTMLFMNKILMGICTFASGLIVMNHVRFSAALASLILNFTRRYKEFSNVAISLLVACAVDKMCVFFSPIKFATN